MAMHSMRPAMPACAALQWFDMLSQILDAMKVVPTKDQRVLHSYGICRSVCAVPSASVLNTRSVDGDTVLGW